MDIMNNSRRICALLFQLVGLLLSLAGLVVAGFVIYLGWRWEENGLYLLGGGMAVILLWPRVAWLLQRLPGQGQGAEQGMGAGQAVWRHERVEDSVLVHPAALRVERPFSVLASQFRACAPHDGLVYVSDEGDFLSWKDAQEADIQIQQLEGEEWLGLFWSRFSEDRVLSDQQLEELCSREAVSLPAHFRKMDANGLLHYRDGKLLLYPSTLCEALENSLMENMLSSPETFRRWLDELIEDVQNA